MRRGALLCSILVFGAVACSCRERTEPPLVIAAASSLREVLPSLSERFTRLQPGAPLRFEFAGSQTLRAQIEHGAPTHVFLSADPAHVRALTDAARVVEARTFTCNRLVLAVPRHNPAEIRGLEDLPRARRIVLAAPEVPLGAASERVLADVQSPLSPEQRAEVFRRVVTRDLSARQTLSRLALGEADAALVYRTDALAAPKDVRIVPLPEAVTEPVPYVAAVLSPETPRARAFVEFLASSEAQAVLSAAGFERCPDARGETR